MENVKFISIIEIKLFLTITAVINYSLEFLTELSRSVFESIISVFEANTF